MHLRCVFLSLLLLSAGASAQLVVDLQKGGATVRSKELRDFDVQHKDARQQRADSLEYTSLLRRAFTALSIDSLDEARRHFRQALRLRPEAPGNYVVVRTLGRIALAQGRHADALRAFSQALKARPADVEARYGRAATYLELGNARQAIEDADVLLRLPPPDSLHVPLLCLRGAAEMHLRLYPDARRDFEEALRRDPDNANAPLLLAMALRADGRPREARQRLDLHLATHPADADARSLHVDLCVETADYAAALADLDTLVAANPRQADLLLRRAAVQKRLGHKAEARRDAEAAVALGLPGAALKEYR